MTRIITCLLIGLLLAVSGCSDKNSVPSGILPHEKMEAVMWDIIQAEQYSASFLAKDSAHINLKLENLRLYDEVFRLHQVSREEFRKSYQYYMSRADVAQVLFDSLLAKGNRLRTESYSRPYRPVMAAPGQATPPGAVPAKSPAVAPVKPTAIPPAAPGNHPRLRDSSIRRHLVPLQPNKVQPNKGRDSLTRPTNNPS
jgi:hypothetical protein